MKSKKEALLKEKNKILKKQIKDLEQGIEMRRQDILALKLTQFTIDNAADAVFWMESNGGFSYINSEACRTLGYTREELLKLKLWDIDPSFPKERLAAVWKMYGKGELESQQMETSHQRKDGTLFPVEVVAKHMWFGDKELHVAFVRNISDRKIIEDNLHESEERFKAIFEQAAVGVAQIVTSTGHYNRINKKFSEIVGYSEQEMLELTVKDITHIDDLQADLINMDKLNKGEIVNFSREKRYIRKDGSIVWVNLTVSPMLASGEEQKYHITVAEDITDRKKFKDILIKSENQLKEANATKDKFFSIISHDLRNPFNTILGFSDLLSSKYDEYADDERKKIAEELNNSAKHTYSLLQNLLNWANTQLGRIEINKEVHKVKDLVADSIDPYLSAVANKKIEIFNNIPDDIDLWADIRTVKTVIGNIFNNAYKFTPKGGRITLSVSLEENFVKINISDTGIGIDEKIRNNLFRIDECKSLPGTENEQGTGLGLILCKEFAEKNDGTIEIESELGKGSTFTIILPRKA